MDVNTVKTVGELAAELPQATRVFEKLGIDYCCGGGQSLEEASAAAHLSAKEVLDLLLTAEREGAATQKHHNWQAEPLANLIDHIVANHHKYVRDEIPRLERLLEKVCSVHGSNHAELHQIRETFGGLAQEMYSHMMKEEMILFPYIARMEQAILQKSAVPSPPFGTVRNPVNMMIHEHDSAGAALSAMRRSSNGYLPPTDACMSYTTLYKALGDFEADLHLHIHLENNILFPRAIDMERE